MCMIILLNTLGERVSLYTVQNNLKIALRTLYTVQNNLKIALRTPESRVNSAVCVFDTNVYDYIVEYAW